MAIEITAFNWVPPFAQGYVKDVRIRWALEEAGLPYAVRLIDHEEKLTAAYRRRQPFSQVPVYRDDEVELFETGAILIHLAGKSEALAPGDAAGRARASAWVLAALNSIEPHAQNLIHMGEAAEGVLRPQMAAMLNARLKGLSDWLGDAEYLEGRFTVGDLMMTTVLRELIDGGALAPFPNLEAYVARGMARPAFGRALEAQLQVFREHAPA